MILWEKSELTPMNQEEWDKPQYHKNFTYPDTISQCLAELGIIYHLQGTQLEKILLSLANMIEGAEL